MRPIPIDTADLWDGAQRVVFAAPDGSLTDDTIRPAEVIVDTGQHTGIPRICIKTTLEDGDLAKLAAGGHIWLSIYGTALPPFCFDVKAPGE